MPAAFIDQAKNKRADPVAEINRSDNFYQLQPGDGFLQRAQGDHKVLAVNSIVPANTTMIKPKVPVVPLRKLMIGLLWF